jgi:Derlin-2/3
MLFFSVLMGNPATIDTIGIVVGHTYYFFEYVYPVVADVRGWRIKRVFDPPTWMLHMCGDL